jgi:hypothetical protein
MAVDSTDVIREERERRSRQIDGDALGLADDDPRPN